VTVLAEGEPRSAGSGAPSGEMRSAIDKLKEAVAETGSNRAATAAMANLAEAIHGLVSHMRTEQQMIRDWADGQAAQNREVTRLLERIAGEEPKDEARKEDLRKTVR
jgi:siroheme synthase (precorrin-2 oxidase/ferrochelatase)